MLSKVATNTQTAGVCRAVAEELHSARSASAPSPQKRSASCCGRRSSITSHSSFERFLKRKLLALLLGAFSRGALLTNLAAATAATKMCSNLQS